jgi:ribose-phosphate pyrophosphokinase
MQSIIWKQKMKTLLFTLPESEQLCSSVIDKTGIEKGIAEWHQFPDGEWLVTLLSDVSSSHVVILSDLHYPDDKILKLYFFIKKCREKATKITLIAPYLPYLRQDKLFKAGETLTSKYFAELISDMTDELITIDPHLHRYKSLAEIYNIPCKVLSSSDLIAEYIRQNISKPLLIGPDSESRQWVSSIAEKLNAPYLVLEKIRTGDKEVEIKISGIEDHPGKTPVLIDDIISSGETMRITVDHLQKKYNLSAWCIAIHAVFANEAYENLLSSGAVKIITTNTIRHQSNGMDISILLSDHLVNDNQ